MPGPRRTQSSVMRTWASECSRPASDPPTGHGSLEKDSNSRHVQHFTRTDLFLTPVSEQLILPPINRCERAGTEQRTCPKFGAHR